MATGVAAGPLSIVTFADPRFRIGSQPPGPACGVRNASLLFSWDMISSAADWTPTLTVVPENEVV